VSDAYERFTPQAMIVGASCTAELIQDDPAGLAKALDLPIPVIPLDLPSYQKKEHWGASETFYQLVRGLAPSERQPPCAPDEARMPSCNILGPTALGFRHRDDVLEIKGLLKRLGVRVNVTAPMDATPDDLRRLPEADFNVVLYPEIAEAAAAWLERVHGQPAVRTVPIGLGATRDFIAEVATLCGLDPAPALNDCRARMGWWSRSVDSTYLTGKRVFIFGEATHAVAAARVASEEMGFEVVGLGAYNREFAREVRAAATKYGLTALITDDYLEVERAIAALQPELVLGTQMERHIAKRLRIGCAVISAPVHVQDFPARYAPQMGFEGANVLFDTWIHPLAMGLEEHLLAMFREDFEFNDAAGLSHLSAAPASAQPEVAAAPSALVWAPDAEKELTKIPFFVRGKARRNTESFAVKHGIALIELETLYDARSHFSR
jgi:light-independent protochlorophyllide reductase subunit B